VSTSRTLTPMRQAESDRPAGIHDHDRPLSDYSLLGGASAGTWLRATLPDIDEVLSSPAARTRGRDRRGRARMCPPHRTDARARQTWAGADVPASPHRRAGATDGGRARVCPPRSGWYPRPVRGISGRHREQNGRHSSTCSNPSPRSATQRAERGDGTRGPK